MILVKLIGEGGSGKSYVCDLLRDAGFAVSEEVRGLGSASSVGVRNASVPKLIAVLEGAGFTKEFSPGGWYTWTGPRGVRVSFSIAKGNG